MSKAVLVDAVIGTRGAQWASQKSVVEDVIGRQRGVHAVDANPVTQTASVRFDPAVTSIVDLQRSMRNCGYDAGDVSGEAYVRRRFFVAAAFAIPIVLWSPTGRDVVRFYGTAPFGLRDDVWMLLLSLPVVFWAASACFAGAIRALRARTLDMTVLLAVAVGVGWGYSLVVTVTGGGKAFYEVVAVVVTFVLLGHWLEVGARGHVNETMRTLLELAPRVAAILRAGQLVEVPISQVVVGDLLWVGPGATMPVDGIVVDGSSDVDESMVSGETLAVHKRTGSSVIAATQNGDGVLRVRATRVGADTSLAHIVQLVQAAQNSKPRGQRRADRAAVWLILMALVGSAATFAAWSMFSDRPVRDALILAMSVVLVASPDAIGLATPTAIVVGTGVGTRRGVLFKNATALETAARINVMACAKTGILTSGEPEVTDVIVSGISRSELLACAAALEHESQHPLARAIVSAAYAERTADLPVEAFENIRGQGVAATVAGRRVLIGSRRLFAERGVDIEALDVKRADLASRGRTVVFVAIDSVACGIIAITCAPRPTSAAMVRVLRDRGISVVLLTGDNHATARRLADEIGIDVVIADVLPSEKAAKIAELQAARFTVAMVRDGVNDASAFERADLGIVIGAVTDAAVEAADLVLMPSDPLDIVEAVTVGRATVRKMRQNLGWAIGYNAVALPVAAGVLVPVFGLMLRPEIAAMATSGSSLLVGVNSLLLKRLQIHGSTQAIAGLHSRAGRSPGGRRLRMRP